MNVTLTLEDEVVRKVRRIAAGRDTTLTGLVRDYLNALATEEDFSAAEVRKHANLDRAFDLFSVKASPRAWKRADLYERRDGKTSR